MLTLASFAVHFVTTSLHFLSKYGILSRERWCFSLSAKQNRAKLSSRLINWFVFTVGFSCLPIIVLFLLNYLSNTQIDISSKWPSESLFMTIMMSSVTLKEILGFYANSKKAALFLFFSVVIIVLFASMGYAIIIYCTEQKLLSKINADHFFVTSTILCICSFVLGTIAQVRGSYYGID